MTENIKFPVGIIPYAEMKTEIDYATYYKFNRSYYSAAGQTSQKHTFCFHFQVCNIQQNKSYSARQCHCPMRKSSEHNFNNAVQNTAQAENYGQLLKFFHNITDIMIA